MTENMSWLLCEILNFQISDLNWKGMNFYNHECSRRQHAKEMNKDIVLARKNEMNKDVKIPVEILCQRWIKTTLL